MKSYKGLDIHITQAGKYYVKVLHKSFKTMAAAHKAIDKWVNRQIKKDKSNIKKGWW